MTYYRNNTIHLMITPSLIASIVLHHEKIHRDDLMKQVELIFPLIKAELFIRYEKEELLKSLIL